MTVQEYQELAMRTKNNDLTREQHLIDGVTGLCINVGSVAGLFKGKSEDIKKDDLINGLGDVIWHIALICESQHLSMNGIMTRNIDNLERKLRGELS